MSTTRKKDITFGKKDILSEDEFNPENGKERITILLDRQVIDFFKKQATKDKGYQTLIRESLRQLVFQEESTSARLAKLEAAVFEKAD